MQDAKAPETRIGFPPQMIDSPAQRPPFQVRRWFAAAAGPSSSSLLYAVIVFIAALPVTGPSTAGGWFAAMAALCLVERGARPDARTGGDARVLAVAIWLINLGFSLAASDLLYFYRGPPQTFGVTLLGVLMFWILVRDYARPKRLMINLIPPLALIALIQVAAAVTQMSRGTPWMVLPTLSSAVLALWVLRSLYVDLSGNLQRFWREATRADQSEMTVEASERLNELAEELAGVSHWRYDVARRSFSFSRGVARILGLPDDVSELTPEGLVAIYAPEDRDRVRVAVRDAMAEVRPYSIEAAILMPDGERRFVATNGAFQKDADGRIITVFGMIMDVTDARRRERALRESEARFRMIADHGTDIVVWLGSDGLIRYVSPSVRALGYEEADLIGQRTTDFVHPDDFDRAVGIVRDLFSGDKVDKDVRREYRVREKGGAFRWLEGNPTLVQDPQTGERSCITSYRDVSARRLLEDDLIEAKLRAEAAAEAKSEFLTNMSHEIRTPLTAIIGFASLLQRMNLVSDQARTYVTRIASSGDVLLSLVNDILDFAKMEQGQVQLRPAPFSLHDELHDTAAMFAEIVATRGLTLELDIRPSASQRLVADSGRLRQVVVNLVSNALKFTDAGGVTLIAEFDPDAEQLQVTVRDTGVGIPPDKLGRLFQRFSQLDGSSNRRHGGTGLGLSICAKLVALMGGGITVESEFGRGSSFRFWIPATVAELAAQDPRVERRTAVRTRGRNILVVDDVAVNRELIRTMLEAAGQSVVLADGGETAVALARQQVFDLVFMDLQMPGMDGYEAARRLRVAGAANAATPIIALSANVLQEHRDATARAGMNGHIAKPIAPAELLLAVDVWSSVRLDEGAAPVSACA